VKKLKKKLLLPENLLTPKFFSIKIWRKIIIFCIKKLWCKNVFIVKYMLPKRKVFAQNDLLVSKNIFFWRKKDWRKNDPVKMA